MDRSAPSPEFRPELLHAVEYLPTPIYSADMAAMLAYQERGSLAMVMHSQIVEAQQHPFEWSALDQETIDSGRYGSDSEAYEKFWKYILGSLKESDSVKAFRQSKGDIESKHDVVGVFKAFERSVGRAFSHVALTEEQRNHFKAVWGERDFGLASMAIDMADQIAKAKAAGIEFDGHGNPVGEFEFKHHPFEALLIANPKLRPIDYWEDKDARGYLRRFGDLSVSEVAKSQMKGDLGNLRDITRNAA